MNANFRWTKGRGNTKFFYTYEQLAQITGLSVTTIRQYVWKKRLDPKDLVSIVRFLQPYIQEAQPDGQIQG